MSKTDTESFDYASMHHCAYCLSRTARPGYETCGACKHMECAQCHALLHLGVCRCPKGATSPTI